MHFLFGSNDTNGVDLVALNIQRGRDHGIQGYIHYYDICRGHTEHTTFDDLRKTFSQRVTYIYNSSDHLFQWPLTQHCQYRKWFQSGRLLQDFDRLRKLYEHVEDIDLYVGMLAEPPEDDSLVGTTLRCLLADQFYRLKRGDRFYYELGHQPSSFTKSNNTIWSRQDDFTDFFTCLFF